MCGIAGIVGLDSQPIEDTVISDMVRVVAHRGPDGEGILLENNVALGHRRLAIVDLSPDGAQPMTNINGKVSIVFNGEIYNYIELRFELEQLGHQFFSRSDTEVILAGYLEWGDECVRRFNGMWSFAIYDRTRKRLFCSRDRFGKKPFYYLMNQKFFAFGSEIRQLRAFTNNTVNSDTLIKFIVAAQAEPLTETFFSGISKLPGSHNLVLDLKTKKMRIERYYELSIDQSLTSITFEDAVHLFSETFTDAVRLRLRSDVPVGTCLSGGLDSSSVAVTASYLYRQNSQNIFSAITASSEQSDNDETHYAAEVAESNNLLWYTIKPSYDDFVSALPMIVNTQEEPFPSASIAMQYFVMQCAKQNKIPVLLDGQGGDELLLGYEKYFAAYSRRIANENGLFYALRTMGLNNALISWPKMIGYYGYFNFPSLRWYRYKKRHSYLKSIPDMFEDVRLYGDVGSDIYALQKLEIERTNLPALLRYEDKNAMSHSIETRLPFLDFRLVELALSLPANYKISQGWLKYILRVAMNNQLPKNIAWRRNKLGFEAPERTWFAKHKSQMFEITINSALLNSICSMEKLNKKYESLDYYTQWRLYNVALWERCFDVRN